jgi:23S rRNA (uridine2552-2'-O)-methyltransferase
MKVKTKSKKVNKAWLNDHVNDPWVKLAAKEGYRARAAYKLREIDETLRLIRPGHLVVDLGSTPGAWSQYVRRRLAPDGAAVGKLDGTIIALDLLPMEPIEGVTFIQGDFREAEVLARLEAAVAGRKADVVVSDMAPNLSGVESVDAARIAHLVELAADFACSTSSRAGRWWSSCFTAAATATGAAVSRYVSHGQAVQTQGLARQVVRDVSGGHRPEDAACGLTRVKGRSARCDKSLPLPWLSGPITRGTRDLKRLKWHPSAQRCCLCPCDWSLA